MRLIPRYPGPWLAKITKWLLRWHEIRNNREKFIESLHRRYGALVQIAPNQISVNSADGIRDVFAVTRRLDRPDPLPILHLYGSENLVSTKSGEVHADRRRVVRSVYTRRIVEEGMAGVWGRVGPGVVGYVDEKIAEGADENSKGSGVVDALMLSRLFAADVGSSVVYGEENALNVLGDKEQRREFEADLKWSDNRLLSLWALFMFWYPDLTVRLQRLGIAPGSMNSDVPKTLVMDRKGREVLQKTSARMDEPQKERQGSLMERLIAEFRERGQSAALPDIKYVLSDTLDHFWAGVTTTGDALGAVFYQLSHPQNKRHQDRLREALRNAGVGAQGDISLAMVKSIDYLDSVIRETLRHSPPIPFSLTRKVTAAEGMEIGGYWVPPGMEVGASPYSVHRNLDAFLDPEVWNPQRWEVDDGPEASKTMKRHSLAFGAGPRMCIGMNVAVAEMKLLLARVYTMYETTLSSEWFLENGDVRPAQDRGELWPRENLLPLGKRAPIVFRRL